MPPPHGICQHSKGIIYIDGTKRSIRTKITAAALQSIYLEAVTNGESLADCKLGAWRNTRHRQAAPGPSIMSDIENETASQR
jgi:hypothetical protein